MVTVLMLWPPLVRVADGLTTKDEEIVEMQAAHRQLEAYCAGGHVDGAGQNTLVLTDGDDVRRTVRQYRSQANGDVLRVETDNGGYVPLLMHARSLGVSDLGKGVWAYRVTLTDGLSFRGVLTGEE